MGSSSLSKLFTRPSKRLPDSRSSVGSSDTSPCMASSPTAANTQPEAEARVSRRLGEDYRTDAGVEGTLSKASAFEALLARSDEESKHSSVVTRTSSVGSSPSEYSGSSSPSTPSSFSHRGQTESSENKYDDSPSEVKAPSEPPVMGSASTSSPQQAEEYLDMGLVTEIFEKIVNPRSRREGMLPGPRIENPILSAYKKELLETVLAIEDSFASPLPKVGFMSYPWEKSPDTSVTLQSPPDLSTVDISVFNEKDDEAATLEDKEAQLIVPLQCQIHQEPTARAQPLLLPVHILLRRELMKAKGITRVSIDGVVHAPNTRVYRSCSIPPIERF